MNYSPKLKRIMKEIEDILKREDIVGAISLGEPGFMEYLNKINASWNACRLDPITGEFRIKVTQAVVGKKEAEKLLTNTVDTLSYFREAGAMFFHLGDSGLQILGKHLDIDLGDPKHTPHIDTQQ